MTTPTVIQLRRHTHATPAQQAPAIAALPNPSGCSAVRPPRDRAYQVKAWDAAGQRHDLTVVAINHHEPHLAVVRHIGTEPRGMFAIYDPEATRKLRRRPAANTSSSTPPSPEPRIPRVTLQADPRPSAWGEPTDIDRQCDAIDSELEQQEPRHSPSGRIVAGRWFMAVCVIGLAVWTAAAIGLGALSARPDRWPELTRPAGSTTN